MERRRQVGLVVRMQQKGERVLIARVTQRWGALVAERAHLRHLARYLAQSLRARRLRACLRGSVSFLASLKHRLK